MGGKRLVSSGPQQQGDFERITLRAGNIGRGLGQHLGQQVEQTGKR
jgi:hypothetical protein